jgi:hypothetical protein
LANGVRYEYEDFQAPTDLETVKEYLLKDRDSQPADEDYYKKYLSEVDQAESEDTVVGNVWPLLAKHLAIRVFMGTIRILTTGGLK